MKVTPLLAVIVLAVLLPSGARADDDSHPLPLKAVADVSLTGNPSRLDYQSLDPETHLLFIAHLGDGVVHVFNVKNGEVVADIEDVASVHGVLAVPSLGRVYASATGTNEVVAIDEKKLKIVARIPGGVYPDGMAFEPDSAKLYVSDENGKTETVIDTGKNERVATIKLGGEVGNSQYDPTSRRILVNVQTRNELVAIDPKTDKVVQRAELEGAEENHGLLIDADRRVAYVACQGNSKLLVVDLDTWKVTASFATGDGNDVLAFDPGLQWLYVASESGVVSVFAVRDRSLVSLGEGLLEKHAHTIAVDPSTHRVYFPLKSVHGKPILRIMDAVVPEGDGSSDR